MRSIIKRTLIGLIKTTLLTVIAITGLTIGAIFSVEFIAPIYDDRMWDQTLVEQGFNLDEVWMSE